MLSFQAADKFRCAISPYCLHCRRHPCTSMTSNFSSYLEHSAPQGQPCASVGECVHQAYARTPPHCHQNQSVSCTVPGGRYSGMIVQQTSCPPSLLSSRYSERVEPGFYSVIRRETSSLVLNTVTNLTSPARDLPVKLVVAQLATKLPSFCESRRFITTFTTAQY
jgi:hypothetical protein